MATRGSLMTATLFMVDFKSERCEETSVSPFLAKLAMASAPDSCSCRLELCSQDSTSWYTRPEPSAKHFCMDSSETRPTSGQHRDDQNK